MSLPCPSCRTGTLHAGRLENNLAALQCDACTGSLLDLVAYRDWLKSQSLLIDNTAENNEFEAGDSKRALGCPSCQRIMLKYKVKADATHNLDFCFSCEQVWLDAGEWDYLKTLGLHSKIRTISTDPWQRQIRDEASAQLRLAGFKQAIGAEAFPTVEEFRLWLSQHPKRAEILRYLNLPGESHLA